MDGLSTLQGALLKTKEGSILDDLIYSFLLRSAYPRASIVFDVDIMDPAAQGGSGMKVPVFVIVDPETADPLAVIEVVGALDAEALKQAAIETGAYASRLAGKAIQGFVIRVDASGQSEAEKVQFYRIWPNSTLQHLSSRNFPDLDALRVSRKLVLNAVAKAKAKAIESAPRGMGADIDDEIEQVRGGQKKSHRKLGGAGLYVPALALLILLFVDGLLTGAMNQTFLSLAQSILAVGAAALLTLPSAIRYLRQ